MIQQQTLLLCICCCLLLDFDIGNEYDQYAFLSYLNTTCKDIQYPLIWEYKALGSNYGTGRGRIKNNKRCVLEKRDVYGDFINNPSLFQKFLFMESSEFRHILSDLADKRFELSVNSNLAMSFENKVVMTLLFVIQYKGNKHLSYQFGVSEYYVSKVLDEVFPVLVEYFANFIPNRLTVEKHSRLHQQIRFIIDNTLHKCRRPRSKQSLLYNGHYCTHGYCTSLMVDFKGNVVAFKTLLLGKIHDALSANHNSLFRKIAGKLKFGLGDTGFSGISYIVPGIKSCHIKNNAQFIFDQISRDEQRPIEHVNGYFKACRSVNKEDTFYHSEDRLLVCIFIAIGMYNMKKAWGYYIKIS